MGAATERALLLVVCVAGCASSYDFSTMPVAELCYVGATEYKQRPRAVEELKRRGESCDGHREEIIAIHNARMAGERVEEVNLQGIRPTQETPLEGLRR